MSEGQRSALGAASQLLSAFLFESGSLSLTGLELLSQVAEASWQPVSRDMPDPASLPTSARITATSFQAWFFKQILRI